jgi:hypothetical protein
MVLSVADGSVGVGGGGGRFRMTTVFAWIVRSTEGGQERLFLHVNQPLGYLQQYQDQVPKVAMEEHLERL